MTMPQITIFNKYRLKINTASYNYMVIISLNLNKIDKKLFIVFYQFLKLNTLYLDTTIRIMKYNIRIRFN